MAFSPFWQWLLLLKWPLSILDFCSSPHTIFWTAQPASLAVSVQQTQDKFIPQVKCEPDSCRLLEEVNGLCTRSCISTHFKTKLVLLAEDKDAKPEPEGPNQHTISLAPQSQKEFVGKQPWLRITSGPAENFCSGTCPLTRNPVNTFYIQPNPACGTFAAICGGTSAPFPVKEG